MSIRDLVLDNPVFVRELRRRMRGRGLVLTLCFYVGAMCLWALATIHWKSEAIASQGLHARRFSGTVGGYVTITDIGQSLSNSILLIQALLVLVVAPTVTAAMVRAEKERQTFDFLRSTAITSWTYVTGALMSTLLYVALALFCGFPVLLVSHLYGGVSDLTRTTLVLLMASVVLSSGGLLVSCVTERGRTAHVALAMLLLGGGVGIYMIRMGWAWSALWSGSFFASSSGGATLWGYPVPLWVSVVVLSCAVSGVMLLISARKLFHPEDRVLNYRQLAGVALGAVCLGVVWYFAAYPAAALPGSVLAGSFPADRSLVLLALLSGAGVAVQAIALVAPVEVGNERWRIQRRIPRLHGIDEAWLFISAVGTVAVCVVALTLSVFHGPGRALLALTPVILFLAAHAALCRGAFTRSADPAKALRLVLSADVVVLLAPAAAVTFLAGWQSGGQAGALFWGAAVGALSPIETGNELLRSGLSRAGVAGLVVQVAFAAGGWIFHNLQPRSARQRL